METKVNYGLVGGFVLLLGAALIGLVLWLASGGAWQQKFDTYLAVMEESVSGLNLNAPVRYNGVGVGKVRAITLDPANPERVLLEFAIDRGTPIKVDTVAVLKTQGLTGIAYVELAGGARDAAPLEAMKGNRFPVIATKPSLSARLENVLSSVLAKLDSTSNHLNVLLSDANQKAFSSALADIAAVAHTVSQRRDTIDAGLLDGGRMLAHSARASAQLEPTLAQVKRAAASVDRMGDALADSGKAVGTTVAGAGGDLRRFTGQTQPDLQRLLSELALLSSSLRRLSEQTERAPSSLLIGKGPVPEGPGETTERDLAP